MLGRVIGKDCLAFYGILTLELYIVYSLFLYAFVRSLILIVHCRMHSSFSTGTRKAAGPCICEVLL